MLAFALNVFPLLPMTPISCLSIHWQPIIDSFLCLEIIFTFIQIFWYVYDLGINYHDRIECQQSFKSWVKWGFICVLVVQNRYIEYFLSSDIWIGATFTSIKVIQLNNSLYGSFESVRDQLIETFLTFVMTFSLTANFPNLIPGYNWLFGGLNISWVKPFSVCIVSNRVPLLMGKSCPNLM